MNELLKESAAAYLALSAYRYHFLLGKKGRQYALALAFPREAFWHLAGLHKTRVEAFKIRKHALEAALSGNIHAEKISDADGALRARWRCICALQAMIESNACVFKYRGHEFKGSSIRAEYLLTNRQIMFFVDDSMPVSIFEPTAGQLVSAQNCPGLTTLQIEREIIASGERTVIYRSASYRV